MYRFAILRSVFIIAHSNSSNRSHCPRAFCNDRSARKRKMQRRALLQIAECKANHAGWCRCTDNAIDITDRGLFLFARSRTCRGAVQTSDRRIANADATARDSVRDKFAREMRIFTMVARRRSIRSLTFQLALIDMRSTIAAEYVQRIVYSSFPLFPFSLLPLNRGSQ